MPSVTGQKELLKQLNKLEKKMRTKSLNKAMSKAVRPVVQSSKANVRPQSVTVAKSIGIKRKRYRRGAVQVAVIGPRIAETLVTTKAHLFPWWDPIGGTEYQRKHFPWKTAHLIEQGTAPHRIHLPKMNLTVSHPGTKPQPFLKPALDKNEQRVYKIHAEVLKAEIEKHARS